ncbi:MAG: hypothetical protein J7K84_00840 [Deltaproteobacteria bacterium]|nr:hypothetical protein [Deltaproteobacteria bacterium]
MFKKYIQSQIYKAVAEKEVELKKGMEIEIRSITKGICTEMVKELFSSDKDAEHMYLYFSGSTEVETVVGKLKKGIAKDVLHSFDDTHQTKAMSYIRGEEFIDTVIDRIQKKQLG